MTDVPHRRDPLVIAIPVVFAISLGIAAWSFNRLVGSLDRQNEKLDKAAAQVINIGGAIENLRESTEFRGRTINERLIDHENRIRAIEKRP